LWPRWVARLGLLGCVGLIVSLPTSSLIGGGAVLVSGIGVRFLAARRRTSTVA
jgi:APA family basic amino acid/polyamine antiporter